jgi:hypothetical protein
MEDAARKGRMAHGDRHYRAKLTSKKVANIREKAMKGTAPKDLARQYGVKKHAINSVLRHRTWKNAGGPSKIPGRTHQLAKDQVLEIRRRYQEGESPSRMAQDYDFATYTIRDVCKRRSWKNVM